ncbi:MAG: TonB-dependent receptor [Cytophagales bacterium]|jgi:iron complex outermembrane receptor protein|nr:TonB-dependent receptor [Bacteroidota bacterium]WHZ06492.1 MAG: TonB-dependent receptor [Cytophagales bacterium]
MKHWITCFLLVSAFYVAAQQSVTGIVKDRNSGQVLSGCTIVLVKSKTGTTTDSFGKFTIVAHENDKFIFSFIGYQTDTVDVDLQKPFYNIALTPDPKELSEVVVTAMTHASLIKQNPIAVSTVTIKMIEQQNESNVMDAIAKSTPGIAMLKSGPNISKPFIRGLGFNRVLTLYDGIRQEGQQWGGEHGLEVDNYNIEKAEIVKGPASIVFGSDALAGVVSLQSFVPKEHDGAVKSRWLSEYQSNNGLVGTGFRLSQGNSHWLWALRGSLRMAKNYSNAVDGRVYNTGFQEKNLSTLIGYRSRQGTSHFNLSLYDNLQGIPDGTRDSLTRKFTRQVYEGSQDDVKNRPVVSQAELNSYSLSPLHQRIQHYRLYLNNHYQFGKGDLNALIAFTQNIRREFNHPTAPDQAGTFLRLNTLIYNLRYNTPEHTGTDFSFGANGMFQNNKNKNATNFPIPDYSLTDFGIYTLGHWKKNNWNVTGGIRLDWREITTQNMYVHPDANGFDRLVSPPDTTNATLQFSSIHQLFRGISLSLGATYQVSDHLSAKFNFARGYRAPSIAEIASNGLDAGAHIIYVGNPNFVPEFSWQQDLGFFVEYPAVSASLSLFNKNIQNYIYLNQWVTSQGLPVTDAQGNRTFQYQQSSAQLYGMEVTFSWRPPVWPGFFFTNQLALCYGFNRNPFFENKKQQGEYLPFIPPARWVNTIHQEINFQSKQIAGVNLFAEMDWNATQNRFLSLYKTETRTPGYTLINVGLGATFFKHWQFQFQVNNLFNEIYQSNLSRLKYFEYYTQSPNGRSGLYGMGRNFCVKLIVNF